MGTVAAVTDHPPSPPGSDPARTAGGDGDGTGAEEHQEQAAWGEPAKSEPRWPSALAVGAALVLYLILPRTVITGLGPRWLVPAVAGLLLLILVIVSPRRITPEAVRFRVLAIGLIAVINLANIVTLIELVRALLSKHPGGRPLIFASVPVWLTNVLVFALWYWELDRGGPVARLQAGHRQPDFLFPQMSVPGATLPDWSPAFFDYLYTSFTNATAFSPTDTMPLTHWAKLLMMAQSLTSLLIVVLVISRAVNILS
jgi:uncharacterized membrane protein